MIVVEPLVGVNVSVVLPPLMLTMPFVLVALVIVSASPSGSVSFTSGLMICDWPFVPEAESLFATGGRFVTLIKMMALFVPPKPSLIV